MVKELWAKLSATEKLIVYGAGAVVVAWLIGVVLGSKTYGGGNVGGYAMPSYTVQFTSYHGMDLGLLAMLAAIVAVAVLYIKLTPSMNITLPAPLSTILLGAAAVSLVCSALMLLLQLTSGVSVGDWPIFVWVAVIGMVGGGAVMTWGGYQGYLAAKTA